MSALADWTTGTERLAFLRCRACGAAHAMRRGFCPACGSDEVEMRGASGRGTVYAVTTVVRAPSAELRTYAPYGIALVDADEGFRFMAQAAPGLGIGDPVATAFRPFAGRIVPFVEAVRSRCIRT